MEGFVLIWVVLLAAGFYFLILRPQRAMRQRTASLQHSLSVGDEVVTIGGIYGELVDLDDDEARLEIAPGTVIRVARRAISSRVGPPAQQEDEEEDEGGDD